MATSKSKLRLLRKELALSSSDLGKRIGKSGATVRYLEKAEAEGSATIAKLSELANALGHELVIQLVPKVSVQNQLEERAKLQARAMVQRIATTMSLEKQDLTPAQVKSLEEAAIRRLLANPRLISN